jgi:hypothetical protein
MSENAIKNEGFRIKWADKEVEYYGPSAQQNFDKVMDLIKIAKDEKTKEVPPVTTSLDTSSPNIQAVDSPAYERISKDAKISEEQVKKAISFEKRDGFEGLVPILPEHPETRDAIRLIIYALQVGIQKTPVEISYLKDVLMKVNGYPLPGSELGWALQDFRKTNTTITSQTQGRNMPVTLSTKGLDIAREYLKKASST